MLRLKPQKLLTMLLLLATSGSIFASPSNIAPEIATAKTAQSLVTGKHSMIVTNNPYASTAAAEILAQGGNATDAAVAAAFMLGLTEPQSSGIGGGGYALVYKAKDKSLSAFDGRETAPASAIPQWFLEANGKAMGFESAMLSPHSVGVPSEVALLYKMHQKNGKLAWDKLLLPAIQTAKSGFKMSPRLYGLLLSDQGILKKSSEIRAIYFNNDGTVKTVGSKVTNPAYAASLELIAKDPQVFYHGKIAQEIIRAVNSAAKQEIFKSSDLKNYTVLVKPALCNNYRESYEICSVPPSSSGGVTVQELMGIYSANYQGNNPNDPRWVYNFLEASKLAFADRNQYVADPEFVKQPTAGLLEKHYITERAQLVNESQALITPVAAGVPDGIDRKYAPDNEPKAHGTTSISIVDKNGNAVSMTVTVEHQFGSHIFTNGFFLNNELTDFAFVPYATNTKPVANRVEAKKRPRSSIAPVMVFNKSNGKLEIVTGSPGGSQIICYVAKNLIQMLDMQQNPLQAVSSGNLCATNSTAQIEVGSQLQAQESALSLRGESFHYSEMVSGETNIMRSESGWSGAADPRREGVALGD